MSAEIESHQSVFRSIQEKVFPFKRRASENYFPSKLSFLAVFVNRKNFDWGKKFSRSGEYTKEHPQNSVYLFPIFHQHRFNGKRLHYLEIENEKRDAIGNEFSPSFSMLNFHFHTQTMKMCSQHRRRLLQYKFKAGTTHTSTDRWKRLR